MEGNGPARAEDTSAEPRADLPRVPIGQLSMNFLAHPPLPRDGSSRHVLRIKSLIPISLIICLFVEYFISM